MTDDPIPISALEHFVYCERQCALILVDGVWQENEHTVRGQRGHRRADDPDRSRMERGRRVLRGVPLFSERLGLVGRADVVEVDDGGRIRPVEYKVGVQHGDAAHVQMCAQALCLEEMTGRVVTEGALWFGGPRRRMTVTIDDSLRERTERVVSQVHELRSRRHLPTAPADERCEHCQLLAHCMPELSADPAAVLRYIDREVVTCGS